MTFTEIKYFIEVYQQKSISRASKNLYVVPSVISEAIKRLECEFNTNLFTRRANKIIPTAAGEQFYFDALEILNASLNLKKNMLQFSSEHSFESICKISLPDSLIHTYSDALFDSLSKRFPNVDFVIETFFINTDLAPDDNRDILLLNVNDSSISKTIETLLNNNQYKIKSIAVTEVYIWCSKNSPIVSLNDISIKDILNSDYKLLALSDRTNTLTCLEMVQNKYVPCVTTVNLFYIICVLATVMFLTFLPHKGNAHMKMCWEMTRILFAKN